jgi:hypothetical protein
LTAKKPPQTTPFSKARATKKRTLELAPGEEARVRFYWELPEKVDAKTILMQYGYDREARTLRLRCRERNKMRRGLSEICRVNGRAGSPALPISFQ